MNITHREHRLAALNDRWERLARVMDERGAVPEMASVPGGTTGLLVKSEKGIGGGSNFKEVACYEVDAVLLRELRAHEEQAARELGQWMEKDEETQGDDDMAAELERKLAGLAAGAEPPALPGEPDPH